MSTCQDDRIVPRHPLLTQIHNSCQLSQPGSLDKVAKQGPSCKLSNMQLVPARSSSRPQQLRWGWCNSLTELLAAHLWCYSTLLLWVGFIVKLKRKLYNCCGIRSLQKLSCWHHFGHENWEQLCCEAWCNSCYYTLSHLLTTYIGWLHFQCEIHARPPCIFLPDPKVRDCIASCVSWDGCTQLIMF